MLSLLLAALLVPHARASTTELNSAGIHTDGLCTCVDMGLRPAVNVSVDISLRDVADDVDTLRTDLDALSLVVMGSHIPRMLNLYPSIGIPALTPLANNGGPMAAVGTSPGGDWVPCAHLLVTDPFCYRYNGLNTFTAILTFDLAYAGGAAGSPLPCILQSPLGNEALAIPADAVSEAQTIVVDGTVPGFVSVSAVVTISPQDVIGVGNCHGTDALGVVSQARAAIIELY